MKKYTEFSDLVGKILYEIRKEDDTEIFFFAEDGSQYKMFHEQDCCEDVKIEDICGNLNDLLGRPIIQAEESINSNTNDKSSDQYSMTWTFYRLATDFGNVVIRWYGVSNGYYSESVSFVKIK